MCLTHSAVLQLRTFVGEQGKTCTSFVLDTDRDLKCLTCISWFALKFEMKPRLTPGKQCSLLMGLGGVFACVSMWMCVCVHAQKPEMAEGGVQDEEGVQRHVSFNDIALIVLTKFSFLSVSPFEELDKGKTNQTEKKRFYSFIISVAFYICIM